MVIYLWLCLFIDSPDSPGIENDRLGTWSVFKKNCFFWNNTGNDIVLPGVSKDDRFQQWCRWNFRRFGQKPWFHQPGQSLTRLFLVVRKVLLRLGWVSSQSRFMSVSYKVLFPSEAIDIRGSSYSFLGKVDTVETTSIDISFFVSESMQDACRRDYHVFSFM